MAWQFEQALRVVVAWRGDRRQPTTPEQAEDSPTKKLTRPEGGEERGVEGGGGTLGLIQSCLEEGGGLWPLEAFGLLLSETMHHSRAEADDTKRLKLHSKPCTRQSRGRRSPSSIRTSQHLPIPEDIDSNSNEKQNGA